MAVRTASVSLVVLCVTFALGTTPPAPGRLGTGLSSTLDMEVEIVRPETVEGPGIVPVTVRLHNVGDTSAYMDSLQVTISDGYYSFGTGIPSSPGMIKLQYMPINWVPAGSEETCTAWITCPADENHSNDTDVVIVNRGAGLCEGARTDADGSPGQLSAGIARATCFVSHTEPLNVTLVDIGGRAVLESRLGAPRAGKSSLDLGGLRSGVYLVRLDDGRRVVASKLVVQR